MLAAWLQEGRTEAEFWAASPAQVRFFLRARGRLARRGTVADFLGALGRTPGVRDGRGRRA